MEYNQSDDSPDLQSILATLASFAPQGQPTAIVTPLPDITNTLDTPSHPTPPPHPKPENPRVRPQNRSTASPKPTIDPATITTWQDGLRCVTKIAAQNDSFAASIRKMIDNQRSNEMRWYAERQALKQRHGSRERASAQASAILKGLNGNSDSSSKELSIDATNDVDDLDKDLATYDRKVYSAQLQMEEAMTAELKGLGVPFFGTDSGAVIDDDDRTQDTVQAASSRPKHSPLVTEKELLELRRRMVEHLEALYRD